jgi:hypothetical protein
MENTAWNRFCDSAAAVRREQDKIERKTAKIRAAVEADIRRIMAARRPQ